MALSRDKYPIRSPLEFAKRMRTIEMSRREKTWTKKPRFMRSAPLHGWNAYGIIC